MADYRFYHLAAGRILSAEVHDCADDGAARSMARSILAATAPYCDAVEIWQLTRMVGTVRRGEAEPADQLGA
jgi:hypothetical protein